MWKTDKVYNNNNGVSDTNSKKLGYKNGIW